MARPKVKERRDVIVMIKHSTQKKLRQYGKGVGVTFDDVINMFMEFWDKHHKE